MVAASTAAMIDELKSSIQDQLSIVTFKSIAKRFNIPYDVSKKLMSLYQQQEVRGDFKPVSLSSNRRTVSLTAVALAMMTQKDTVDAAFLLSGLSKDGKTRVVRVVDASKLDESKSALSRVDAVHVYALGPKGVMVPENIVEVDLVQNREALGTTLNADYASLGRVALVSAPERRSAGAARRASTATAASPPKTQGTQKPQETTKATNANKVTKATKGTADTDDEPMAEAKPVVETKAKATAKEMDEPKRKAAGGATEDANSKKKRVQMIDSDSDEDEPAQVKTYINDKGEEVTEIIAPEKAKPKAKKAAKPEKEAKEAKEAKGTAAKKPAAGGKNKAPVGPKQKGIMGFFKPKQ